MAKFGLDLYKYKYKSWSKSRSKSLFGSNALDFNTPKDERDQPCPRLVVVFADWFVYLL